MVQFREKEFEMELMMLELELELGVSNVVKETSHQRNEPAAF